MTPPRSSIDTPVLPPAFDAPRLNATAEQLRQAIGENHVVSDPDELLKYLDPYPLVAQEDNAPSLVLYPGSVEDVQAILRIANETGLPVAPISTGKNNGYGGASPRLRGSAIMDLGRRMNRILEVNEKFGYALVEPGVTFFQLAQYLRDNASSLMIDTPDLGWGSIVGNTMERGVGYTPYGDHFMWQTGMEVVLPTGVVMRTGMGALPGSNAWQLYPYGFGPYPDGLFTQSNFGVCTKMGIALMKRPPASMSYLVTFEHEEDLAQVMEIMLPLRINMYPIQNVPVVRNIVLDAGVVSQRAEWQSDPGPLRPQSIARMKKELGLGHWNFYGTLYGDPATIDNAWRLIRQAFAVVDGARFHTHLDRPEQGDRGAHVLHDRHRINNGIPSLDELKLLDWIPHGAHSSFSPISAVDGQDALRQSLMVRRRADEYRKDYAAQFIIGLREMHHIGLFLYDRHAEDQRAETLALMKLLIREAAEAGYGEYRTHNALMDDVMATFNWNDGALLAFHEKIKDALDPNSILAPGKSGIWGRRFRQPASPAQSG
ncbi:MAG: FAD-binding oxidoreductase [Comamonas sp.]